MTLREKFKEFTKQESWEKENYNAIECEKIADDYAIEFAEWVVSRAYGEDGLKLKDDVLQKFKKEKGL